MVDHAVATTGDLITYRIAVEAETDFEVEIPEVGAAIAGFRIVDFGAEGPTERGGRTVRERWYRLRADLVGSYVLPPFEVRVRRHHSDGADDAAWQTLTTSEIFVEVASVLPADLEAEDIKGLKPLRRVRSGPSWIWIGAAVLVAALAIAALIGALRRRAPRRNQVPSSPPHEVAFAALDELRGFDFEDRAVVRRFFFRVSAVIRAYVEARFELNATDLTTEEIIARLGSVADLDADHGRDLQRFLIDTDQVKFAHREPTPAEIEATYESALQFVESTRPATEPSELEQAA